ncbi:MAG: hypothetical protein C4293_14345 [Nitrospiraceae bacterium]
MAAWSGASDATLRGPAPSVRLLIYLDNHPFESVVRFAADSDGVEIHRLCSFGPVPKVVLQ